MPVYRESLISAGICCRENEERRGRNPCLTPNKCAITGWWVHKLCWRPVTSAKLQMVTCVWEIFKVSSQKKKCWRHQSKSAVRSLFSPYCNKLFFTRAVKLTRSFTGFALGLGFFSYESKPVFCNAYTVCDCSCVSVQPQTWTLSYEEWVGLQHEKNTRNPPGATFFWNLVHTFFFSLGFPMITSKFLTPSWDCKLFILVLSWDKKI